MQWLIEHRIGAWKPTSIILGDFRGVLDFVMANVDETNDWRIRQGQVEAEDCLPVGRLTNGSLVDVTFRRLHLYSMGRVIDQGLITAGHYGMSHEPDNITDLGCATTVIPLAFCPVAIDMADRNQMVHSYDEDSGLFQHIKQMSENPASNCMWGKQFLLYLVPRSTFVTYNLVTKVNRELGNNLVEYISDSLAVRLRTKKHTGPTVWYQPTLEACRTRPKNLPSSDMLDRTRTHFARRSKDFWRSPA